MNDILIIYYLQLITMKNQLLTKLKSMEQKCNAKAREIRHAMLQEPSITKQNVLLALHDEISLKSYRLHYMQAIIQLWPNDYHSIIGRIPKDLYKPEINLSLTI